jgi:hypothetical protein
MSERRYKDPLYVTAEIRCHLLHREARQPALIAKAARGLDERVTDEHGGPGQIRHSGQSNWLTSEHPLTRRRSARRHASHMTPNAAEADVRRNALDEQRCN